uniref:Uncharacterized protein n=1 Tax=Anguilla anguilla TaxID=7936 RepID=A0A0E9W2S9_ANGAN
MKPPLHFVHNGFRPSNQFHASMCVNER